MSTTTRINIGTSSEELLAARVFASGAGAREASRSFIRITNNGGTALHIRPGVAAATAVDTLVPANGGFVEYSDREVPPGAIQAISITSANDVTVEVG